MDKWTFMLRYEGTVTCIIVYDKYSFQVYIMCFRFKTPNKPYNAFLFVRYVNYQLSIKMQQSAR